MKADWAQIGSTLGLVAGGVSAAYGAIKAFFEGRSFVSDWIDRRRDPSGFRVKSTICKVVIREDRSEFIKLRTVRANRKVSSLRIDHRPVIVGPDGKERFAVESNHYAVPGRATKTDGMFQIDFMTDEELQAHQDYSVVLGYIMEERRTALFDPPEVILLPPVGSDLAVIEVHFEGHRLATDPAGKPAIRLYTKDPKTKEEMDIPLQPQKADVTVGDTDLDWIRARVHKPAPDVEIRLLWSWSS